MSKQRAKGTRREKGWLPMLQRIWPDVQRIGNVKGPYDMGDYIGTGDWVVESKHAAEFSVPAWVRQTAGKAEPELKPWVIFCRADKRKFPWDLAIMPAEQAAMILEVIEKLTEKWRKP